MKTFTQADVIEMLKAKICYGKNQCDLAKELKVSRSFICDVLRGNRYPGPKILEALQLETCYRKKGHGAR